MPDMYFGSYADEDDLVGGDAQLNAQIMTDIFDGMKGPKRNVVVINSAAAIVVGGKADTIKDGIAIAENVIDSGKAKNKLKELVEFV